MAKATRSLPHGPLGHAVIHWLTGVVFAALLSLLLLLAGPFIPGLAPFLTGVEMRGVDAAMRVRLVAAPDSGFSAARKDPGYVFLDIDPAACEAAHAGPRCRTRSPADPAVAAKVAAAALADDPRVVIIDVMLWDTDPSSTQAAAAPAMEALAAAARAHPNTRVVAVSPFRPTGSDRRGVVDWTLVPPSLATAPITFAPSFAWRGAYELDGVMRRYPATVLASNASPDAPAHETPTLPYLAALYAADAGNAAALRGIDCQYNGLIGPQPADCEGVKAAAPKLDGGLKAGAESRILYSLPSLTPGPDGARPFDAAQFQGLYDVYPVSQVLDDKGALREPVWVKGKVVVISSSAITALDHHDTPLGDMAGAEVVLNAVKAFLDGGLITEPGVGAKLGHEAMVIGVSSIPFLVFWVLYFQIRAVLMGSRVGMIVQPAFATLGFLATVAAAMGLAAVVTIAPLTQGFEEGFALEFFTPIFALSLEGFAEGARWTIDRIEAGVELGVVHARRRAGQARRNWSHRKQRDDAG